MNGPASAPRPEAVGAVAVLARVLESLEVYRSGTGVSVRCRRCQRRVIARAAGLRDLMWAVVTHDCSGGRK